MSIRETTAELEQATEENTSIRETTAELEQATKDLLQAITPTLPRLRHALEASETNSDPGAPCLTVYVDPQYQKEDGKGFCVEVEPIDGPTETRRFPTAAKAGKYIETWLKGDAAVQ